MTKQMRIEVSETKGSTPREVGAFMIVGLQTQSGTIGGGRLEYDAIAHARSCLENGKTNSRQTIHLGPKIGQCCGGQVVLSYRLSQDAPLSRNLPQVLIFGGGHLGKALAQSFSSLPLMVHLVETRSDYLQNIPQNIVPVELAAPEAAVRTASPKAAYIIATHDHASDFLIVEEALGRGDAAYIGMVGSQTKRAVLETRLKSAGLDPSPVHCPIGAAGLGDKRVEVIAAFTVAEVLSELRKT